MKSLPFFLFLAASVVAVFAQAAALTEKEAREFGAEFLNEQLAGKKFEDAAGAKRSYPKFRAQTWAIAKLSEGRWILVLNPPAGLYARVSFDADGKMPKLEFHGFSHQ